MMGVLFKPNGLKAFCKYHSSDFENSFIDAALIFDNSFPHLLEQIQKTKKKLVFECQFLINH